MSSPELLREYDEKQGPSGFFLPLYKEVCKNLTKEQEKQVENVHGSIEELLVLTHGLGCLNSRIDIKEEYPGKSAEESKNMKEAGNK